MNKKILITQNDQKLYKGKMVNMPVKHSAIKEKSVELFDDDEPCIIHQSYCMKHFAEDLNALFDTNNTDTLDASLFAHELSFLDVESLDNVTITRLK